MPRKCPPGVFCIENTTIVFLIIMFIVFVYIMTQSVYKIALVNPVKQGISFPFTIVGSN